MTCKLNHWKSYHLYYVGQYCHTWSIFCLLHRKSSEALCICEKDITSLRQQLQETNKELAQTNKNRESLAQENDRLQEHLSNIKQENQVYL